MPIIMVAKPMPIITTSISAHSAIVSKFTCTARRLVIAAVKASVSRSSSIGIAIADSENTNSASTAPTIR
jgi:hypothetical protein